jgi:putative hydrolase of the HAD superfamily
MAIRAVLFDLGDTLWHFPNFPDRAVATSESGARIERLLRAWDLCDGVACDALADAIRDAQWQATLDAEESHGRSPHFPTVVQERAEAAGLALSDEQAEAVWDAWNLGGAFYGRVVFPDSAPTLAELRRRGFIVGAVTNRALGGRRFAEELRESGLLEYFETLAISCDDGWLKPHPSLFRRALEDLRVKPAEAVMVGDQLRADVMGAKALGMVAVWKRPPGWERQEPAALADGTPALPDYAVDRVVELLDLPILADADAPAVPKSGADADRPALR